ncbi:MAG: surface antigen [Chitinophagaceae bacterium]|nr:MAG: surface antigen [Chitinophagaceae bacterium]
MNLTLNRPIKNIVFLLLLIMVIASACSEQNRTFVRNYPKGRAFVYQNKINLIGNISKDEKKRLLYQLDNYWDDSLKVRKVQIIGFFYKIKRPAAFDSTKFNQTINQMNAYLNSQGYYYATLKNQYHIDTVKDQIRTYINMDIVTGQNIKIDTVIFELKDSMLQQITNAEIKKTELVHGNPYSKQVISSELDRLVNLYRRNGYYKFTREDIYAYVDSTNPQLLELTLDPFEQAKLLANIAKAKKENPTWDITVMRREQPDSSRLFQYKIGKIYYYPEMKITDIPDSVILQNNFKEFTQGEAVMRYKKGIINYKPLKENTYFKRGDLYNESNYFKSVNSLSQLGVWQNVDLKPVVRGKDSLDYYFFMTPTLKQSYTIDLEGSRNSGLISSGSLLGISTNFSYVNRNVWKRAIQGVTTFRTGVELNILNNTSNPDNLIQSFLVNAGHTYIFPRIIQPFKGLRKLDALENRRTLLSINAGYVDRRTFYRLRSVVTSWGYEWRKGNNIFSYKPLNIEINALEKLDSLDKLIEKNPFLRTSFNEGNIVSQSFSINRTTISRNNPNKSNYYRFGVEDAGAIFGLIPGIKGNIYRYIKVENEYRHSIKMPKSELAFRAYGGIGYNYSNDTTIGITLPFFKQFSGGGPNSMRAWTLRQLGLGSSTQAESDTSSNAFRDRYGDMQLEVNLEYRFTIASFGSLKIGSAVYTDIGNIWNINNSTITDPATLFSLKNLGRDLAIGLGTGLRFDMSYFLIRFDFAYKLKDPLRTANGGWMSAKNFEWTDTRANGVKIPNFALQLGIGLPF